MKKVLNTLYITSTEKFLALDGENIVIKENGSECGRLPLHNLEGIVTMGYSGISPALLGKCAEMNIFVSFLSRSGRYLASVVGPYNGNVVLRQNQYRTSESDEQSIVIAKNMITGKLYNSRWVGVSEEGLSSPSTFLPSSDITTISPGVSFS